MKSSSVDLSRATKTSLLDIQINGFAGVDFQQADLSDVDLRRAVDGLAKYETRRFFLTLVTDGIDSLCKKLENIERCRNADEPARDAICGYHIEGPWLSPETGYCGAHDTRLMCLPKIADFDRLQEAADGNIKLITLAPEVPGSTELIEHAVRSGVQISFGHTNASDADIDAGIAAGARLCTHLGNGVPNLMHRHDNVTQRLLARDELTAFFIPDGIHVPPFLLKNFFRAKPRGKALFTTDCMSAAGAPSGRYRIGHIEVDVGVDRIVRSPGTSSFAGSALTPSEGVVNLRKWLMLDDFEARSLFSTAVADLFHLTLPELT
jgi:N-acetylglucosamine-6-phosphate deacetylase